MGRLRRLPFAFPMTWWVPSTRLSPPVALRADLVTRALRRELRRRRAIDDLDRLGGDDPELAAWVEYAAHTALDLD